MGGEMRRTFTSSYWKNLSGLALNWVPVGTLKRHKHSHLENLRRLYE